jgi:hypothetical protein
MFLVRNHEQSFFTQVLTDRGLRFDPGCMSGCDERAREVSSFFAERLVECTENFWRDENQVLVFDNRQALHARSKVNSEDLERELTRVAFKTKGAR